MPELNVHYLKKDMPYKIKEISNAKRYLDLDEHKIKMNFPIILKNFVIQLYKFVNIDSRSHKQSKHTLNLRF